jgi:hypothetical protein
MNAIGTMKYSTVYDITDRICAKYKLASTGELGSPIQATHVRGASVAWQRPSDSSPSPPSAGCLSEAGTGTTTTCNERDQQSGTIGSQALMSHGHHEIAINNQHLEGNRE